MIILFDGICNLCNGFVNFIIEKDTDAVFKFGSIQSDFGQSIIAKYPELLQNTDSVILLAQNQVYVKSEAAIRIAMMLKSYKWIKICRVLPLWFRDKIYDIIAKNRYWWFGKRAECRIPTPGLKARFLS